MFAAYRRVMKGSSVLLANVRQTETRNGRYKKIAASGSGGVSAVRAG
jgi:hypothetical protein